MRTIQTIYQDPLELIWLRAAADVGWRVERDGAGEVFASFDGRGVLRIGERETLDPDDSLAQMILHEICHALVEGPAGWSLPDWGLEYGRAEHTLREHAALRLQAALAGAYGLRQFLAPTTDYREYFDQLPENPLAGDGDLAIVAAYAGWQCAKAAPWAESLAAALARTAELARIIAPLAPPQSLWSTVETGDLLSPDRLVE